MPNDEGAVPNGDPQETADASGSQVGANETQQTPEELSNDQSGAEFGLRDELAEQFPLETINVGISPDDGLPTPMDASSEMALAPAFGPDSVVCIEDEREFVEVFTTDDLPRGSRIPEEVERALYPREFEGYVARRKRKDEAFTPPSIAAGFVPVREEYASDGRPNERRSFDPSKVIKKWGTPFVETAEGLLLVRARRERCEHYKRMVFANDDPTFKQGDFGHQVLYRNCSARRSVGGALMSVQDQAVYACEHRSPADFVSVEKFLDGPDRKRMATKVEMVPLFNIKSEER